MSVIIRLQNLPWAANAADIRAYFSGLSIPEGGVHIVGGEQGDAFIAFSTDEDARQAMLLDGGKLKEVKIKLFLSSRAEMLRVIEQARQQTLTVQNLIHSTPATTVAPAPQPVTAPVIPVNVPHVTPTPPVVHHKIDDDEDSRSRDEDNSRESRRERYRSSSRERGRSRGRDNSRERSRGRYRDSRRRRDRTRSRDRHRRRSRSRDRRRSSREKDNTKEKDHSSRTKGKVVKEPEIVEIKESPNAPDEPTWEAPPNPTKVPLLPDPPAVPPVLLQMQNGKESIQNATTPTPPVMNFSQNPQDRQTFNNQMQYNPQMGPVPPQAFMQMRGREGPAQWNPQMLGVMDPMQMGMPRPMMNNMDMGMAGYPPAYGMPMFPGASPNDPMWRQPMMQPTSQETMVSEEQDLCIEIRGLPLNVSYIDVKKLFDGLSIPPDGIKMINDNHGNRTGIAYVRFNVPNHKQAALNQNGKKVRSNIVEVLHLRDSIFKTAIDNFKPEKEPSVNSVDMDIDNGDNTNESWNRNREKEGENKERDRGERDRDRDRAEKDRERGRNRMRNSDPRMNNDPRLNDPRMNSDPRINNDPRLGSDARLNNDPRLNDPRANATSRTNSDPRSAKPHPQEIDDHDTDCVLLQGLPLQCNENDIADFFDDLELIPVNIFLVFDNLGQPLGDAFCQFNNFQEAQRAVTKNNERMGRNIVNVRLIRKEEMDRAVQETQGNQMWGASQRGMLQLPHRGGGMQMGSGPPMGGPPLMGPNYPGPLPPERYREERSRFEDRPTRWDREDDRSSSGRYRGRPERPVGRERGSSSRGRGSRGGGSSDSYTSRRGGPPPRGSRGTREPSPYIDGNSLESFGRPGCVVALENLHFRAEIEEIIDFFKGFVVEHENVIRRFDDSGRPTGDARVALNSPSDAMRAVKVLNFKLLRGRPVKVSILS